MKRKILIVDDEPINLEFFDVMLSRLGFTVIKAEDGEEALQKIREENPDLLILDNIMPNLSGWEVTRILKNDVDYIKYRDLPVIMFSAMDDVRDKVEGFELGIEDYITKPFNFSEVLARIKAVLRSKELGKQLLRKEKHLSLIGSFNKTLVFFTQHLRKPMLKLIKDAEGLDYSDRDKVEQYIKLVTRECDEVLAALDGFKDEINELEERAEEEKKEDKLLVELEEKFKKHFESWKKKQDELDGVKR